MNKLREASKLISCCTISKKLILSPDEQFLFLYQQQDHVQNKEENVESQHMKQYCISYFRLDVVSDKTLFLRDVAYATDVLHDTIDEI